MKKRLKKAAIVIIVFYVGTLAMLTYSQRDLLYHPWADDASPEAFDLSQVEALAFQAEDGAHIHYWYHTPEAGEPLIVYFHGNAARLQGQADLMKRLQDNGFGVAMLHYRGFGASEGKPTEQSIYSDAAQMLEMLVAEREILPEQMVLYGESLGTGVAVEMATRFDVRVLVLQAPYTAIADRAQELYPYIPVHYLLFDRYDSLSKMAQVHAPLLLIHGELDQVIPIQQGQRLFKAANEPKQAYYRPEFGHNDFDRDLVIAQLKAFLAAQK